MQIRGLSAMNKGNKRGEIYVYGVIGDNFWGDGITDVMFIDALRSLGDVKEIDVRINSAGGYVAHAKAMYNALTRHVANVTTYVDGMAFSCASWLLMAGNRRVMAENAEIMIHDPSTIAMGDAKALRKEAEILDGMKADIAKVYADRTGLALKDIDRMMSDETWFRVGGENDPLKMGFVDEVTENLKVAANFDPVRLGFKNVPEWALKRSQDDAPDAAERRARRAARAVSADNYVSRNCARASAA